jgi:hypothetical protein
MKLKSKTMVNRIVLLSFLFLFNSICLYAQQPTKGWGTHTSMSGVIRVSISGDKVWAASTGGLFSFNISSPLTTIKKYTTFDGLLDNELSSMAVDNAGKVWSGATDGSVSVYDPQNGIWRSMTDVQISTETSKRINDIFQYGNSMFISTQFSLIQFSIPRFQFIDQPYSFLGIFPPKTPVLRTFVVNDTVWAGTVNGIAYANINSELPVPTNWHNFTTSNSPLVSNQINAIAYFNGKVFFGTEKGMVYYQNHTLNAYLPQYNGSPILNPIKDMTVLNNSLYFTTYGDTNNIFKIDAGNLNNAQLVNAGLAVNSLAVLTSGAIYTGTALKGVDILSNNTATSVIPNGPFSNLINAVAVDLNKNVWAVSGALGNWVDVSGIYKYNGTSWKNYTYAQYPQLGNGCCGWVNIYPSKFDPNTVWICGFGTGLLKITGDNLTRYNDTNSILQSYLNPGFVLATGAYEDNNTGDLWVINNYTTKPFVNFTKQIAYPIPLGNSSSYFFDFLVVDNYGTKWTVTDNSEPSTPHGVLYFNEAANTCGFIGFSQLGQNIQGVNNIIVEKNGEVWIATNDGIVIVQDPYQVIANPNSVPNMFKMSIIADGLSTPLLEDVISLTADALNNKWIGTLTNGVLYVSPDGTTLLNRYNILTSPIADNKIVSIAQDQAGGNVYFGTSKGMSVYSTIAVQPLEDCSDIKVGPSPFIIPNSSLLRIDGLVAESSVKILTISGKLVYEFQTEGGRIANWDGRDFNGNLVSSGIYIIAGYNKDATKVCPGKVAIVRR